MNILALEPYYGGSHQALLDGWIAHSRHHWTLLTLPPHKWKWRMRHAAVTLAEKAGEFIVTLKVEGPQGKARRAKLWDVTLP